MPLNILTAIALSLALTPQSLAGDGSKTGVGGGTGVVHTPTGMLPEGLLHEESDHSSNKYLPKYLGTLEFSDYPELQTEWRKIEGIFARRAPKMFALAESIRFMRAQMISQEPTKNCAWYRPLVDFQTKDLSVTRSAVIEVLDECLERTRSNSRDARTMAIAIAHELAHARLRDSGLSIEDQHRFRIWPMEKALDTVLEIHDAQTKEKAPSLTPSDVDASHRLQTLLHLITGASEKNWRIDPSGGGLIFEPINTGKSTYVSVDSVLSGAGSFDGKVWSSKVVLTTTFNGSPQAVGMKIVDSTLEVKARHLVNVVVKRSDLVLDRIHLLEVSGMILNERRALDRSLLRNKESSCANLSLKELAGSPSGAPIVMTCLNGVVLNEAAASAIEGVLQDLWEPYTRPFGWLTFESRAKRRHLILSTLLLAEAYGAMPESRLLNWLASRAKTAKADASEIASWIRSCLERPELLEACNEDVTRDDKDGVYVGRRRQLPLSPRQWKHWINHISERNQKK